MSGCETPLLDLLRAVPADARLVYEHSPIHIQSIPVGVLAAKCVAEIERLTDDYAAATHLLADRDAQIERLTALNSALTDKSNGYVVENARLTAELATLRASAASVQADQRAEIDAANAALDELRADAERYQWLAKHCRSTAEHWGGRWSIIVDGPSPKRHDDEDDFHAAIDAARTLRKGTT